ncbi:MAG TPA: hypothetical protein VLD36_14340 [Burkholderiales bacterium]|jgi:NAD(P)-dependent dehydrogenase (short-subunit alcohol dehydrogenase family)|nr:hypothetical protein [Burkholderiales bacterium]
MAVLAGRAAVVTGSTSGIGLGIAQALAPDAARMRLLGEKQPSLEFATPEQIGALATFLCTDGESRSAARR